MSLAIRPVNFSYAIPKAVFNARGENVVPLKNDIAFTSLEAASALEAQALSGTRRSLISTDKTRLGANFNKDTNSVDFKLASMNATDVFLCIFDEPEGKDAALNIRMTKKQDSDIWETSVPIDVLGGGKKPVYYGYRVFGPNWRYSEDFFNEEGKINNPKSGFDTLDRKSVV